MNSIGTDGRERRAQHGNTKQRTESGSIQRAGRERTRQHRWKREECDRLEWVEWVEWVEWLEWVESFERSERNALASRGRAERRQPHSSGYERSDRYSPKHEQRAE